MKDRNLIESVDIERLYKHVLNIEGLRHPLDDSEMLDIVGDYLSYEFEEYGLVTKEHIFQIGDFDQKFRNIEGLVDNGAKKELIVSAHYDTVSISPGANDNTSGIAGMLEIARILANLDLQYNIRFIGFTLEEGHPQKELQLRELMETSNLVDEDLRFTTYHSIKMLELLDVLREDYLVQGKTIKEAWNLAVADISKDLTNDEKKYIKSLQKLYEKTSRTNWIGKSICVGSTAWVEANKHQKQNILGVLNLEEIGYKSEKNFSQKYPAGIDPMRYPNYKVDIENRVGNFVGVFADKFSKELAQSFCFQCKHQSIDLPYHSLEVPLDFVEISQNMLDLLRSDHSPFWREHIPAISITDTFEFRYPFYHTSADISDYLDFDFMKKIVQVTLATTIALTEF